jgi:hypothetical protein
MSLDFSALVGETGLSDVRELGVGDNMTRGPVHFDLRATTSASNDRSENETLGCDLSCRQALFVGTVLELCWAFNGDNGWGTETEWGWLRSPRYPSRASRDAASTVGASSALQGQSTQGVMLIAASEMAVQNALPNESSAQAIQLAGSPEQLTGAELGRVDTGKTVFKLGTTGRRRSGTAG